MDKEDILHLLHFNLSPFDDINERYSPRSRINDRIYRISKSSEDASFLEKLYISKKFPKDDLDEPDDELLSLLKLKPNIQNTNVNLSVKYDDEIDDIEDDDDDDDNEVSFNLSRVNRKKLKKSQSELIFHREKPKLNGRVCIKL